MQKRASKQVQNTKKNKAIAIIVVALVVILAAVLFFFLYGNSEKQEEDIIASSTFLEGVSVGGVDVSGKTLLEAEPLVKEKADELLCSLHITYSVNDYGYEFYAEQVQGTVDHITVLKEAMLYGKTKTGSVDSAIKKELSESPKDFPLSISAEREAVLSALENNREYYNQEPVDAQISVKTSQNEQTMTCSGKLEYTEGKSGMTVNDEALADEMLSAIENGETEINLQAELIETKPELTVEDLKENVGLMASFSTKYTTSAYGRRFNIWKMSTVVNGLKLNPGEEWSINDAAGPRTTETGWADAAGIKSGGYVDEPGGGVCQVSSTLYGAVLRAEVKVVYRKHHSWPLTYVDPGLDATISTGGPDFIIKNPYNTPIYIIVTTDASNNKTVKVDIYGPKMDYKLDFTTKVIKETEAGELKTVFNPSLSPGTSVRIKETHNGIVVEVYKHYYDKSTGQEIKDPELYYTDTYAAFAGEIQYGPSKTPAPSEKASASVAPEQTATVAPEEPQA